jgi:hypothetical protein
MSGTSPAKFARNAIIVCALAFAVSTSFATAEIAATQPAQPVSSGPSLHQNPFYDNKALARSAGVNNDSADPLGDIATQMDGVGHDLGAMQTNKPVQEKEKVVLGTLSDLIKELEKQTSGGGTGANPNPSKPAQRSTLAKGPGGQGPLHDPAAGTRVWGQLPPKQREQILQSQTEGFPAGYDSLLSNYYSQLARGQSGAEATGTTDSPATQPTRP